jgi:hypothetical protein
MSTQGKTENYNVRLDSGQAIMTLPARLTWEERNRLKHIIDLIPDPPTPKTGGQQ